MPRNSSAAAAASGASTAAAAASARLHKQRHSENESARRARLKDKFLALAALLGQQEAHHSDHDSDTPTATTAAAAANGKSAKGGGGGGGGGGESGSRLQTLAMAIEKLHANKETIDKLEARCASLQAQLAAATRNNAAATNHAGAATPAAGSSSILLQQQQLQQQAMRQHEIDRLMASNASLQAQLMASSSGGSSGGAGSGGVIGGSGPGLSSHLDSDYLMSLVGQQQQRHVPGQQHLAMGPAAAAVGGSHAIKRSASSARLGVMGMGMNVVPEQLYAHQPSSSAPPVSAAAAERGLAQISLDRGLSSLSHHSVHSHASSAASASSFLAATGNMSINMPHKRRRTTEDDGGMSSSGSASPPASSTSTLVTAASLGVAPLSSYPLLNAQPCVLLTPSAEVIDCTNSFVRLLSDGNDNGDEGARKQSLLSQSLFTLLAPSELKSTLALIKHLWTTGAQAQAAELARAGVNDTAQSNEADTLMGIEDAVKNFLLLDSRPSSSARGAPAPMARVLSVRLVLLAVMDRASHSPHVLLGLALPVQPEGPAKSLVPAGFPHGVKACLAEMARECGELLGDEQQRYLVAALYGTPKSRLDPASAAASNSAAAAAAAGSSLRTSMSHHNLHSMASAAAAMASQQQQQQPPYSSHSRTASLHYRHPSGSGLDASLGLTPTNLQRSRTESPPPQGSHYDQDAQALVPLQLRSPLVEAVPTPADHAPLDEEAEPELPAFAAPSPLLLHRNSIRNARSSSDASVFRSPVDSAPALLPDDDAIDLDAQPPVADGEGDEDADVAGGSGGSGGGGGGGGDDDADVFSGRPLCEGDEEDDDGHALPPFASPLLLHTLSGQSLPLSPLPVRGNSVHKQIAAGARAALIGQDQDDEMDDVMD